MRGRTNQKGFIVLSELKIDRYCIPYPRKGWYWIINVPYLLLLISTAIYLWQFGILISAAYTSLYIVSVILHGYVCAVGGCPYKGKICPGAFAYFPVGKMAMLYDKLKVKKSDTMMAVIFVVLLTLLLGIVILPLPWISKLGTGVAVGYVVFILLYFIVFILAICPKCAMRFNCPAANLSDFLYKLAVKRNILEN